MLKVKLFLHNRFGWFKPIFLIRLTWKSGQSLDVWMEEIIATGSADGDIRKLKWTPYEGNFKLIFIGINELESVIQLRAKLVRKNS